MAKLQALGLITEVDKSQRLKDVLHLMQLAKIKDKEDHAELGEDCGGRPYGGDLSLASKVFTMKMEILLEPTSNKLMVAGNPVKKILLKLNLSDHRSILTDLKACSFMLCDLGLLEPLSLSFIVFDILRSFVFDNC
ncbi:hypothetical protein Tco_0544818 [Tanacetum coccineum]